MDNASPEASASNQQAVSALSPEVLELIQGRESSVGYIAYNDLGEITLDECYTIDLGDGHDYGTCVLNKNPKLDYNPGIVVTDESGEALHTGEWMFEVCVPKSHRRRVATGEVKRQFDPRTATMVETPVYRNETTVMVIATQATPVPVPGAKRRAYPDEQIGLLLKGRKTSERMTGKLKPAKTGGKRGVSDGDVVTDHYFGSVTTGEIWRLNAEPIPGEAPAPEHVVPEGPQRAAEVAAYIFDSESKIKKASK